VAIELVFETHSTSEDNEAGRAAGWLPGGLSQRGRTQAQLGTGESWRQAIARVGRFLGDLPLRGLPLRRQPARRAQRARRP